MQSAASPRAEPSALLIYPASEAPLVYFIALSEIPVSAHISAGWWASSGPFSSSADVEECELTGEEPSNCGLNSGNVSDEW